MKDVLIDRETFFGDPSLDSELPFVNSEFWSSLIGHIEKDCPDSPRVVLDVGCHTGGLLHALNLKFGPTELFGIEPLPLARRAAAELLNSAGAKATLLDPAEWDRVPSAAVDLMTSHEELYLEPDLGRFMRRLRRVLVARGTAYIVLGCHAENPLWQTWKMSLVKAGHSVYDHLPLEIMQAAALAGLLPSVQPLRNSGWITYDPLRADFKYPDIQAMLDHHYRYKLIFRLRAADDDRTTSS